MSADPLTAAEHTEILFLLDALSSAPGKSDKLLAMARHEHRSRTLGYRAVWRELAATPIDRMNSKCSEIRKRMM